MAQLPVVFTDSEVPRDWLEAKELQEAFRIQRRFIQPDWSSLRWTALCIMAPTACFLRWIMLPASRGNAEGATTRSCALCCFWGAVALGALCAASFQNPGVVPRPKGKRPEKTQHDLYPIFKGVTIRQRWCKTCQMYRPLRSKHCSYCDRCIFRFDHHCTLLGNCVGLGNYRSFLALITTASIFYAHSVWLTGGLLRVSYRAARAEAVHFTWKQLARFLFYSNVGKVLFFAYGFVVFSAFMVLLVYHLGVIAANLTTNEHVKDYYLNRNPFERSCIENYRQVLCTPCSYATTEGAPVTNGDNAA